MDWHAHSLLLYRNAVLRQQACRSTGNIFLHLAWIEGYKGRIEGCFRQHHCQYEQHFEQNMTLLQTASQLIAEVLFCAGMCLSVRSGFFARRQRSIVRCAVAWLLLRGCKLLPSSKKASSREPCLNNPLVKVIPSRVCAIAHVDMCDAHGSLELFATKSPSCCSMTFLQGFCLSRNDLLCTSQTAKQNY